MIIDSFMFDGELDMLELRLRSMDWCDHHILVEAAESHRGEPKPRHFEENLRRFQPWMCKITYVRLDGLAGNDPWSRLKWQHDQVARALSGVFAQPEDTLLVSDVDEILPPEAAKACKLHDLVGFRPRIMMYAVDWEYPGRYEGAPEPRAICLRLMNDKKLTVTGVRDWQMPMPEVGMGFHFTWLGGVEAQTAKLSRIAHTEVTPAQAERITSGRAYRDGEHISGQRMQPVEVDETYPEWIKSRQCPESWFRLRSS